MCCSFHTRINSRTLLSMNDSDQSKSKFNWTPLVKNIVQSIAQKNQIKYRP